MEQIEVVPTRTYEVTARVRGDVKFGIIFLDKDGKEMGPAQHGIVTAPEGATHARTDLQFGGGDHAFVHGQSVRDVTPNFHPTDPSITTRRMNRHERRKQRAFA